MNNLVFLCTWHHARIHAKELSGEMIDDKPQFKNQAGMVLVEPRGGPRRRVTRPKPEPHDDAAASGSSTWSIPRHRPGVPGHWRVLPHQQVGDVPIGR